ncbi:MAG TPA: ankyrin repeat domain-containing protein [Capsulimonadaceae bacterium]|jgi:ankyrin repeat protein
MPRYDLHYAVITGDLKRVKDLIAAGHPVDNLDGEGWTPLMYAVTRATASVDIVRFLSHSGANLNKALVVALFHGDPRKVAVLISAGGNITYKRDNDFDALIDAVSGRELRNDPRLMSLLSLLVSSRVDMNGVSSTGETALKRLTWVGRFDAVKYLVSCGSDPSSLGLTDLMEAVVFGTSDDVQVALSQDCDMEARSSDELTPWLLACLVGDLEKTKLLQSRGADTNATGYNGQTALILAVESGQAELVKWLLDSGSDVEQADDFGNTPLVYASQRSALACVDALLAAGADISPCGTLFSPIEEVENRDVGIKLLQAGAALPELENGSSRVVLGLRKDPDITELYGITLEEYQSDRARRFGVYNPELIVAPFWEAMIRAGVNSYNAGIHFDDPPTYSPNFTPVWCADRFGQSFTMLPDGRIVQVAGEHEDGTDPDFCIFNDVFVHEPDGSIKIYGYPEDVFPPTDFHTATLIVNEIYLIGALGYFGCRQYGVTPVYKLDTVTFRLEKLETHGDNPGWIYDHQAMVADDGEIRVSGGKICDEGPSGERQYANTSEFVFNTAALRWRRLG